MVSYNQIIDVLFTDPLPIVEPVTVDEAKDFCKIELDYTNDNDLIVAFITTARQMCEAFTNTGFIEREVRAVLNNGNGNNYLPYGPIGAVTEVKDAGEVITSDAYSVTGEKWKRIEYPCSPLLTVTYTGGYAELPAQLKTGLLNAIYYLYDNRSVGVDNIGPIAKTLLNPYSRNV